MFWLHFYFLFIRTAALFPAFFARSLDILAIMEYTKNS